MGIANFRRDRKKTISIVASLSLGGVILLVTASILLVRSPERIARQFFPDGDYKIYINSEKTEYEVMSKGNPLIDSHLAELLSSQTDGAKDTVFPFLQMGLFVLVLFGLEVILSFWTMRRQKNQSLVEEMRAME